MSPLISFVQSHPPSHPSNRGPGPSCVCVCVCVCVCGRCWGCIRVTSNMKNASASCGPNSTRARVTVTLRADFSRCCAAALIISPPDLKAEQHFCAYWQLERRGKKLRLLKILWSFLFLLSKLLCRPHEFCMCRFKGTLWCVCMCVCVCVCVFPLYAAGL